MKLVIEISLENNAFYDNEAEEPNPEPEIKRILQKFIDSPEMLQNGGSLNDINGNKIGEAKYV